MNGRTYNIKIIEGYPRNIKPEIRKEFHQEYDILPKKYKLKTIDPEQKNISTGGGGMSNINHCVPSQGGMSKCDATSLRTSQQKFATQEMCTFYQKAQFEPRCMWEVHEEYCWSIQAQDQAKG
jgi:hypothetical protein